MHAEHLITDKYTLIDESYQEGIGQVCIQVPAITSGWYKISLYKEDNTNDLLFSFTVQKVGDTINITYGRLTESLKEFRVSKSGEIHILSKYGKRLYYYAETTLDSDIFPKTSGTYPLNDDDYLYEYQCGKDSANVYTSWNGIDILGGSEEDLGNALLQYSSTNDIKQASSHIAYTPMSGDKYVRVYLPDQSVNKTSDVEFNQLTIKAVSNKYLKTDATGKVVGVDLDASFVTRNEWTQKNTEMSTSISNTNRTVNGINETLSKAISDNYDDLSNAITEGDNAVTESLTTTFNKKIADGDTALETAYKAADKTLTDNLNAEIKARGDDIVTLTDRIKALEDLVASYKEALDKADKSLGDRLKTAETDISNLKKNKQDNLTFTAPLSNTDNTVSIDESDIVHKSKAETITGNKTVKGVMTFSGNAPVIPTSKPTNSGTAGAIWRA